MQRHSQVICQQSKAVIKWFNSVDTRPHSCPSRIIALMTNRDKVTFICCLRLQGPCQFGWNFFDSEVQQTRGQLIVVLAADQHHKVGRGPAHQKPQQTKERVHALVWKLAGRVHVRCQVLSNRNGNRPTRELLAPRVEHPPSEALFASCSVTSAGWSHRLLACWIFKLFLGRH